MRIVVLLCCWLGFSHWASAAATQPLPLLQKTAEDFVRAELAGQPGEFKVHSARLDPRLQLAKCPDVEPFLPAGSRLRGNTSVGVRCKSPETWSIYVPLTVEVKQPVVVVARPLASGQQIEPQDVTMELRDITYLPGTVLTATAQAEGRMPVGPVAHGTILRAELLRAAQVIRQGQTVQLTARGESFTVTSEGTAMGNATEGQTVAVKTRSGQIVKGIARPNGKVEVNF
jgi:flagella basal body P-ring formation protein FlgA